MGGSMGASGLLRLGRGWDSGKIGRRQWQETKSAKQAKGSGQPEQHQVPTSKQERQGDAAGHSNALRARQP
jgi:hypothetical protein